MSLALLSACQCPEASVVAEEELIPVDKENHPQNVIGLWGLTSYLDSIVINKEIARYRLAQPSWFAILIDIRKDSIFLHGSILDLALPLSIKGDTVATFNSFAGRWMLLQRDDQLLLQQSSNQSQKDTAPYHYRLRNDLRFLTKDLDPVHQLSSNITHYFHQQLLVGSYQNSQTNKAIEFHEGGQLTGFLPYNSYQIKDYFGTSHNYQNLDVVYFKQDTPLQWMPYHWKIKGQVLTLTKLVLANKTPREAVLSEQYVLGKETITLQRK